MIKSQLKQDGQLLTELHVAKELGLTLGELRDKMTYEELWLWSAYFGLINDLHEEQTKKIRNRRR